MLTKYSPLYGLEKSLLSGDFCPQYQKPLIDVSEDNTNTYIEVDLPGIKVEDMEISVENQVLTIRGERKVKKNNKYYRTERYYGLFERSFVLSDSSNVESIEAISNNGVLKIKIPKKPSEIPKKINIKAK